MTESAEDEYLEFVISIARVIFPLATFLGGWGYAIHEYGWFLGLAFGWIPSAILAVFAYFLAPLLVFLLILLIFGIAVIYFKQAT